MGITLREFKEIIEFNIMHNLRQSILGLGAPGLGKSQIVKELADKYGYRLIDLRLAQMSEVEIGGLIYPDKVAQKTQWLKPDFFPEEDEQKTILLLDEITSASKRVQVAAYQLVLDRCIGKYMLPDSTVIIALGNREEDDGIFVQLAAPLANRFNIYEIDLNADIWLEDFAMNAISTKMIDGKKKPFHFLVSGFISSAPYRLHTQKDVPDDMIFASPRSWEKVSDILNAADVVTGNIPIVIMKMIRGCIDAIAASEFFAYCRNGKELRLARQIIIGEPYNVPQNRDANIYTIGALCALYAHKVSEATELKSVEDGLINIFNYGLKLPAELMTLLVVRFRGNNRDLLMQFMIKHGEVMGQYCKNSSFITKILNSDIAETDEEEFNNTQKDIVIDEKKLSAFDPNDLEIRRVQSDAITR